MNQRTLVLGILCLTLGGCAALPQPEIKPVTAAAPAGLPDGVPGSTRYQIDQASLTIHTYRAGWLKGLAHNHVMTTDRLQGDLFLVDPLHESAASLYFRPWDLVLDDPAARTAAGSGFESERSAADIAATRARMLGPRGFDSNSHPFVVIRVSWVTGSRVSLQIRFRGKDFDFEVPVTWSRDDDRLRSSADFELSHRQLGIEPYSAFAGAIAVADPIRVMLDLSAVRVGAI